MLTVYHTQGFADAMALGQIPSIPEIPDVTGVVEAVEKFNAGLKEMKDTFSSFASAVSGFKIRTEHQILGLENTKIKLDLPPGGEILKRALPPLIITTAAVVGVAYLVSYILRRSCPMPYRGALPAER